MGRLVMVAGGSNISEVVDMGAVRAAVLSCQRFTALYLCSTKLILCVCVCVCQCVCVSVFWSWGMQPMIFVALKQYSLL